MQGLTTGRMVHYVVENGGVLRHLAAVVTTVWGENGTVNLYLFPDLSYPLNPAGSMTSVPFSETPELGKWHWIEKA